MALRVFRGNFLIAFDQDESPENELNDYLDFNAPLKPATLEEVKDWCKDGIVLDADMENAGDAFGFQSCEMDFGSMKELSQEEIKKLYPNQK